MRKINTNPNAMAQLLLLGQFLNKIEEVVSFSIGWMVANVEEAIGLLLLLLLGRRKVAVNRQTKNTL